MPVVAHHGQTSLHTDAGDPICASSSPDLVGAASQRAEPLGARSEQPSSVKPVGCTVAHRNRNRGPASREDRTSSSISPGLTRAMVRAPPSAVIHQSGRRRPVNATAAKKEANAPETVRTAWAVSRLAGSRRPRHASVAQCALRRQDPRQEPGALAAHAGICGEGAARALTSEAPSLPRLLDLDLKSFFDSLDHSLDLKAVAHHTNLRWILL